MKLCKIYGLEDARDADPLWQKLLLELCPDWKSNGAVHRKHWEWALGLYGLYKLGCIRPDAQALSVGAGVEWPLFYLANHVKRVVATDLYSDVSHFQGLDPTVPENVARMAPFPFRQESLQFLKMDALALDFPDDTFDFAFTFSSIEHFGGHPGAALSMQEIARVLKPGGIAVVSTEVVLDGKVHSEFFLPEELEPWFVTESGMELVEPLDLHIEPELVANPVIFNHEPGFQGYTGPHTSVLAGGALFTSVEMFLRKPVGWARPTALHRASLDARRRAWWMRQRLPYRIPHRLHRPLKAAYAMVSRARSRQP